MPLLRVNTHLVQVDVIVNDKHGNPVTGLTKEDFVLLDDKRPQRIYLCTAETNLPRVQPPPPLLPDTYSNRLPQYANGSSSVTVILLDALNTPSTDQAFTRKQVLRFLDHLHPQDRVALYWLGNNLYVLNDFTNDPASLRAALLHSAPESSRDLAESDANYLTPNNPNPSVPAGLSGGQTSGRAAARLAFDQRVANESVKNRAHLTLAALAAIARHLNFLPGRKNLVWVSGSFPFSLGQEKFNLDWASRTGGGGFAGETMHAAQALTDAGVAVYPVDARGLMGNGLTAAGDYSEAPPPEFSGEGDEHLPSRVAPGNLETMKVLAERTGGMAFYGSNDLSEGIRRAIDDARLTYTLGFYPADTKWDGMFHSIKVRVNLPGVEVRSRTGYFAIPDSAQTPPQSVQAIIAQTATSQLDATGIGLRLHVQPASAAGEQAVNLDLDLDPREIHLQRQNNGVWTGTLQTVFLELNRRGEIVHVQDESLQLTLPQDAYEQSLIHGLKNSKHLRILPDATQLCVVLRDPSTGNIGSLSVPLAKYLPPAAPPGGSH